MKITFIKDIGPNYFTGWSAYYIGEKADLKHGLSLIADGSAREGWESVKSVPETPKVEQVSNHTTNATKDRSERPTAPTATLSADVLDYTGMSAAKVRAAAKEAGVWHRGMSKSDMIAAMESDR